MDSWSLPNLYFKSNSLELDSASKLILKDDNLLNWINNIVIALNLNVELDGYVAFEEPELIANKRLALVMTKLIELGLPQEKNKVINKGKSAYYYRLPLEGCNPYYLYNKDPILIDEKFLKSELLEKDYYNSLRRTVVVKLVKKE